MTSPRRNPPLLFCAVLALSVFLSPVSAFAGAYLSKTAGLVQMKSGSADRWDPVKTIPAQIVAGDSVRTGLKASATLQFEDGSHVELGSNSSFTLEEASGSRSMINLGFGAIKAFVQRLGARRFQVRTPTAVCSVRGTEFRVEVMSGGRTVVDLYKGLLGVEDHRGQQVLLHPNERLQVDLHGIGQPNALPSQTQLQKQNFHALMQKEMVLDLSKEQVMAAALSEIKTAEFQQGKSLIDVFGNRVRVEQYIVRPAANQFKLVVLNERQATFNYFYYLGTFNTTLPQDITIALRQIGGTVGVAPTYWLTGFQTGRSNTKDSVVEIAQGGHPVDVNSNGVAGDAVTQFFDPVQNKFVDVTGQSVFMTLFDKYGFYINGGLKYGWSGNNIQTYNTAFPNSPTASSLSQTDPITGAAAVVAARTFSATFPNADQIHQVFYESYSDGTFTQWDNYVFDDKGKVATLSDFAGLNTGTAYKEKLLQFNFEQVISATEFGGRKIDIVVAPKILIQAGLIQ